MTQKIAEKIVDIMQMELLIRPEQREYYIYAVLLLIEKWLTLGTIIGIGILKGIIIQTLLFLGVFLSLRKYTGGFHASKFWQCYIGTVVVYILITFICPIFLLHIEMLMGCFVLAVIYIAVVGTINHPNMGLNNFEMAESKHTARCTLFIESTVITTLWFLDIDRLSIGYMTVAIILCASLLAISKLVGQEVRR